MPQQKSNGPTAHGTRSADAQRYVRVATSVIENYKTPFPSFTIQQSTVAEVEAEQSLVAVNRELIERLKKEIQFAIMRVWGENEPAIRQRWLD